MISKKLQSQIDKYKKLPRWNSKFPPYIEQHYFDNIPVYFKDRVDPENNYYATMPANNIEPNLIIVKFDNQIVFAQYNKKLLLDRLPFA